MLDIPYFLYDPLPSFDFQRPSQIVSHPYLYYYQAFELTYSGGILTPVRDAPQEAQ